MLGVENASVRTWREGVDFFADTLCLEAGLGVLRSPRHETVETSYEGTVNFGDILAKEIVALRLMADADLPTPEVRAFHRSDGDGDVSWVIMSLIEHDYGADPPREALGTLTARLHAIRPKAAEIAHVPDWRSFIWERISMRIQAARAYLELPSLSTLAPVAKSLLTERQRHSDRLLHMDLRAENICCLAGEIVGVIDVANCLVGDPMLELGRIRAYGLLDEAFLRGYGAPPDVVDDPVLDLYELDTAALLTVVAIEEIDDPDLHRVQGERATALASRLVDTRHR